MPLVVLPSGFHSQNCFPEAGCTSCQSEWLWHKSKQTKWGETKSVSLGSCQWNLDFMKRKQDVHNLTNRVEKLTKKNLCGQYANGRAPAGSESSQHWSEGYSCRRAQWTICNTVQWIIFPVDHGWEHPSMVLLSSQQRTSKGSFTFFISILEDLLPHDIYSTVYLVNIILQWRQYS